MLQIIRSWAVSLFYMVFSLCAHCTHIHESATLEIEKPLIQNLTTAQPQLQNLKYSLVRLHALDKQNQSSFGTGFFFNTRELLVTTLHTFAHNSCLEKSWCTLKIGFAQNEKNIEEVSVQARVVSRDHDRDLLFLEIKEASRFSQIRPLKESGDLKDNKQNTNLVSAGFFQDGTSLTFSHGKSLKKDRGEHVTTMIVGRGFSGAPVVNGAGELVGVISSYHPLENNRDVGIARFVELSHLQP